MRNPVANSDLMPCVERNYMMRLLMHSRVCRYWQTNLGQPAGVLQTLIPLGQSFAYAIELQALVQFRVGHMNLSFQHARLSLPCMSVNATFADTKMLAMNFAVLLTALFSRPSKLSLPTCVSMLRALCICSCGPRTTRLSATACQSHSAIDPHMTSDLS